MLLPLHDKLVVSGKPDHGLSTEVMRVAVLAVLDSLAIAML